MDKIERGSALYAKGGTHLGRLCLLLGEGDVGDSKIIEDGENRLLIWNKKDHRSLRTLLDTPLMALKDGEGPENQAPTGKV